MPVKWKINKMPKYSEIEEQKEIIQRLIKEKEKVEKQNEILSFRQTKQFDSIWLEMEELAIRHKKLKFRLEALGYEYKAESKEWVKRIWS